MILMEILYKSFTGRLELEDDMTFAECVKDFNIRPTEGLELVIDDEQQEEPKKVAAVSNISHDDEAVPVAKNKTVGKK